MLNTFAKFLLVSTSLSPLLGAVAVNKFARGEAPIQWGAWFVIALLLVFLCGVLLFYGARNLQKQDFYIKKFERNDKEVLTFLITYLLPFLSTEKMGFASNLLTGAYILGMIFLVISHAGAFHFNPVMGLLGYHFYEVKDQFCVSSLLISKAELRRPGETVETVCLAQNIYLHTGGKDA